MLLGIGQALGLTVGVVGGAIISGLYFGDKMSPLSDTTNLANMKAWNRFVYSYKIYDVYYNSIFFYIIGNFFNIRFSNRS